MKVSRRRFMASSASAVMVAGTMAKGTVWGANDRIRTCTIGFHGQGNDHIRHCLKKEGAEIVALCDVDANVLEEGVKKYGEEQGKAIKGYSDLRDVMADDSIDVITTATPNHWHSLITVWGCQAGKDVYVEKPMAHSTWEGRQCVEAAKKYGRIVQHGTQSRSNSTLRRDMKLLHEGFLGKVVHSRGYVYKNGNRFAIGHGKPAPVPDHLNWDLWQGPAKPVPFQVNVDRPDDPDRPGLHVHYDWHWFWEYGNGEIGNQGVHEMDIACWGMAGKVPVKISSTGGRYAWDDDAETPNTQATQFTYADGTLCTFEVRNLGSFKEGGDGAGNCGNSVFCEHGYYIRGMGFFDYQNKPIEVKEEMPESKDKFVRFFEAVRSRKQEDAPMTVQDAHLSCMLCQLGNVAYRVGHTISFDPKSEQITDSEGGNALLKRDYREGFSVPEIS
jgi:predicted dehydrogenase